MSFPENVLYEFSLILCYVEQEKDRKSNWSGRSGRKNLSKKRNRIIRVEKAIAEENVEEK